MFDGILKPPLLKIILRLRGRVVVTTAQLYLKKPELSFYAVSNTACGMLEICYGESI